MKHNMKRNSNTRLQMMHGPTAKMINYKLVMKFRRVSSILNRMVVIIRIWNTEWRQAMLDQLIAILRLARAIMKKSMTMKLILWLSLIYRKQKIQISMLKLFKTQMKEKLAIINRQPFSVKTKMNQINLSLNKKK